MNHMANVLASFIPQSMGRFLPLIIGVGSKFGVNPAHIAIAMVVCRNCATFISPVVPATFLGVSLVCMATGLVLGGISI